MFESFAKGPQVVVGSSMGGWMALLLARELRQRAASGTKFQGSLAGLVLVAPAPDFTEELMWKKFSPEVKRQIETTGSWQRPSEYSEDPYVITRGLIEDGRKRMDQHVAAVVHDRAVLARIVQPRFYDVEGTRLNA